ncbi:MAG: hypothetical protein FP820_03030 [Sulfurimonas sp.]|nr:hypothetical protein [Sulfurimonas sp.]MBU3940217.1 hypothetical protein [bacterium]MBU4024107.1 hypothetical protein [bacterium]MBU4058065.1 hypothetical protein [bacterium]MBU4111077.1 hypothetical protein [bacterium]
MRRIVLSTIAALAVGATSLSAAQQFYVDENGQVFTTSAPDRIAIENKETPVFIKGVKLEFSGTHYFGYTVANPETTAAGADADSKVTVPLGDDVAAYAGRSAGFEARRNYVQVKAFFNDKDYFRVTMDTTKELASKTSYANIYAKYAYLYLDEVLPFTGVEVGIVHRPWIDYEEHNAWHYRSFNKVMLEEKGTATEAGVDLVNSADLGFNLKTKTDSFSSEIGMFNGEGYHADKAAANQENGGDISLEWRLTGHLLGSGKKVGKNDRTKATYANISTYGLVSKNHKDDTVEIDGAKEYDRTFYGLHAVYNQPEFLIAAQYAIAEDKAQNEAADSGKEYKVWSINGEYRPVKDWTVIGRYDNYTIDTVAAVTGDTSVYADGSKVIAALAYKMNKNVTFIGSGKFITEQNANDGDTGQSKDVYMLTTEVKW